MPDIADLPPTRLEIRDLHVVLALAEAGSTARAAKRLHLTQPAVSRALLALEDKLGATLFERSQRGLAPTAAGERLLAGARSVLQSLCDLEQRACRAEPARKLRLVCECYTAYHWLPSALQGLKQSAPGMTVAIETAHTADPVPALLRADIDVALLTTAEVSVATIGEAQLFSDEVVFVIARDHPLAARKTLTRAQLRSHTLITSSLTPPAEAAWFLRTAFGRRPPRLTFQRLPLTEAILDVARAGLGIAVLSEWIAAPHLAQGGLVARRLDTGPLLRPWRIAYRRELGAEAQRLAALLQGLEPHLRRADFR